MPHLARSELFPFKSICCDFQSIISTMSFNFVSSLGHGSFGLVLKNDNGDGSFSAVKVLFLDSDMSSEDKYIARECNILANKRHTNIVEMAHVSETKFSIQEIEKLSEVVQESGAQDMLGILLHRAKRQKLAISTICIKMELCGPTLRNWLQKYTLANSNISPGDLQAQQVEIAKDLIYGIQFLHNNKILHRDFKPENVFFSCNNKNQSRDDVAFVNPVKIGDFGMCRVLKSDNLKTSTLTSRVGTVDYMAPENNNNSYGFTSDLFSLGLVIWEVCQLIPFHLRRDYFDRLVNAGETKLISDHPLIEGFPKIVVKLTKRNPLDRIQSADDLLARLHRSSGHLDTSKISSFRHYVNVRHTSRNPDMQGAEKIEFHGPSNTQFNEIIEKIQKIKIVIVGDTSVGKAALFYKFLDKEWVTLNAKKVVPLVLLDTSGIDDYDRLRPLAYPNTDVILMCFSIDSPDSVENVSEKWAPEVKHFCPLTPIILVGTKLDLREDPQTLTVLKRMKQQPTTYAEGLEMAARINAVKYMECSSISKDNGPVEDVFTEAILAAMCHNSLKQSKSKCVIS